MRSVGMWVAVSALVMACGGEDPAGSATTGGPAGSGAGVATSTGSATGGAGGASTVGSGAGGSGGDVACHATPRPADAPRAVVVAKPYDANGANAPGFEVFELSPQGELTRPGTTFTMGRTVYGEIVFTPDGEIGVVAQDDGTLGVFRIVDGEVDVVHAAFSGSFYAGWVTMSADGTELYVLDSAFQNDGGGLYRVAVACDGTLTDEGLITASKLARRGVWSGGELLVAASEIGTQVGVDLLAVDPTTLSPTSAADVFTDEDAVVGSLRATADGRYALLGDTSAFSVEPNRVAVASLQGGASFVQLLPETDDPASIRCSPLNDRCIVTSGLGDAIYELAYDPQNASTPFALLGELSYQGGSPQIPVDTAMVERGPLDGRVLVTEVARIRQLQFADGAVNDLGFFEVGSGVGDLVGAIGVQP